MTLALEAGDLDISHSAPVQCRRPVDSNAGVVSKIAELSEVFWWSQVLRNCSAAVLWIARSLSECAKLNQVEQNH
jgi:hypothetical protein